MLKWLLYDKNKEKTRHSMVTLTIIVVRGAKIRELPDKRSIVYEKSANLMADFLPDYGRFLHIFGSLEGLQPSAPTPMLAIHFSLLS